MSGTDLRVLLLEYDVADAERRVLALQRAEYGVTCDIAINALEFETRLRTGSYDIVLAAYSLPVGLAAGVAVGMVIWCASVLLQFGVPTSSSRWDADALGRKLALAARETGPRLLLISGSSGDYGIRCAILQRRSGLPCINLAVHAGFRLRCTLNYAQRVARRGDIILLAFEYQVYGETGAFDPVLVDFVMARDPDYVRSLRAVDLARFLLSVDGQRLAQNRRRSWARTGASG